MSTHTNAGREETERGFPNGIQKRVRSGITSDREKGVSTITQIGLFGFGCVGRGFYELAGRLNDSPFSIRRIGVKHREKKRPTDPGNLSYDPAEILYDPEIALIVEAIDNADEAFAIVSTALRLGKKVVTANKKMLAEHLPELTALERLHGGALLYEAAVCGNIPIIRTLDNYYRNIPVRSIEGILNGSSNYILSRMRSENLTYQTALWLAQDRGFAESDPTLDVGGFDARSKLSILARHAFGERLPVEEIITVGINGIDEQDIRFAAERGYRIKLIASARRVNGRIVGSVLPGLRPAADPFFNVEDEDNSVVVETGFGIRQQYFGKGAGSHPTGEAVLADVLEGLKGYAYGRKKEEENGRPEGYGDETAETFYVRTDSAAELESIPFDEILEKYTSRRFNYAVGKIRRTLLADRLDASGGGIFIASLPAGVQEAVPLAA